MDCAVAASLDVPIVVTEEDATTNGHTAESIRDVLPMGTPVLDKAVFGAADNPAIAEALAATGRSTVVLVGMETDVCVAHSALGLIARGSRVVVVSNAVYSAGEAHADGLARLRQERAELLSAKELYYEWLRDLAAARAFNSANPHLCDPPGFSL